MSAAAYMDFVAAQCLVSISNRAAVQDLGAQEAERLRMPEREAAKEPHAEPGDAWKDYCTLVAIAKSLLDLNKYRPIQTPSICSDCIESPDEDMGSDSDVTTESGSSPSHSPEERQDSGGVPGSLSLLHGGVPAKGKLASEKRHKCPYSGCGKVYGKSSHLKAHYRVHTEDSLLLRAANSLSFLLHPASKATLYTSLKIIRAGGVESAGGDGAIRLWL
ncbi:Krueppel-like factor 9 isoform X2 [Ornithorhynchus anatinus]|uniref:Krueppel-like factor 9 isoform X2 n=1 Tax=Ornithorhynchus anatinus TaxID=9258 RepID=UPI0004541FBC|nr:Krueppel-like factor 9 isoform X2 [Ornithorhynchus anatinus]XP_028911875.1 Krueppel-like factor 9 isoform X2 [Ornithorhynchus anatinus]